MRVTSTRGYTRTTPVPKLPPGLVELMEGLTKDVLRNSPTNIYEFCSNHMEKLIELRDGPSREKCPTLKQKIAIAQEKVRQRARERQEQYELEVLSHQSEDLESGDAVHDTIEEELVSQISIPVYHEQDLTLASEVEISLEPSTDSSMTSKESTNESEDTPVSKSSTVSSISRSTVIEILNNEQEPTTKDETEVDNDLNAIADKVEVLEPLFIVQNNYETTPKSDILELTSADTSEFTDATLKIEVEQSDILEISNDELKCADPENLDINSEIIKDNVLNILEDYSTPQNDNHETKVERLSNNMGSPPNILPTEDLINIDGTKIEVLKDVVSNMSNQQPTIQLVEVVEHLTQNQSVTELDASNVQSVNYNNTLNAEKVFNKSNEKENEDFRSKLTAVNENSINKLDVDTENDTIPENTSADSDIIKYTINKVNDGYIEDAKNENAIVHEEVSKNVTEFEVNNENIVKNINVEIKEYHEHHENELLDNSTISKTDSTEIDENTTIGSDLYKGEDEVLPIDENEQNNMDLETAAVTIQKVFRSFLFKSRNSTFEDITNEEAIELDDDSDKKEEFYATATVNHDRRPGLGLTRMDTVLQTVNEEKSLSLSTDDSSTLSSAATTIQAHVRGFLVRNRLNSYKTVSTNSLVNSNEMFDTDSDHKSKTVLNIHIVPEQANYLSRDESLITSMDLSLDGSPPSSVNLHPLSYDLVSERRKLLKREDAIQSVSPPSNNSGKLSEDSVKEVLVNENDVTQNGTHINGAEAPYSDEQSTLLTAVETVPADDVSNDVGDVEIVKRKSTMSPDESDVVTPTVSPHCNGDNENPPRLVHSGEFHDVVLPTKVSRGDTTVVREFKNVFAPFNLLWNAS